MATKIIYGKFKYNPEYLENFLKSHKGITSVERIGGGHAAFRIEFKDSDKNQVERSLYLEDYFTLNEKIKPITEFFIRKNFEEMINFKNIYAWKEES